MIIPNSEQELEYLSGLLKKYKKTPIGIN